MLEAYRGIYRKGINRSEDAILEHQAKVLSPEPAKNEDDIEAKLLAWKDNIRIVMEATDQDPLTPEQRKAIFLRMLPSEYQKFLKLFYHKAYVWQFLEANGELEMFFEAQERVRDLIARYEEILGRCVEEERTTNTNTTLMGARGPPAGTPPP